ncbi:hypothetical protein LINPERPRIM_LOCUS26299 [Linum perenne]
MTLKPEAFLLGWRRVGALYRISSSTLHFSRATWLCKISVLASLHINKEEMMNQIRSMCIRWSKMMGFTNCTMKLVRELLLPFNHGCHNWVDILEAIACLGL